MSASKRTTAAGLLCAAVWLAAAAAGESVALDVKASGRKTMYIDDRAGNNQVSVLSESTLEDFTVVCNQVKGKCELDPKDLATLRGRFSLRVEHLRTGIELRDEHLRGPDWMDAKNHPEVTIDVTSVEDIRTTSANEAALTLVGTCTIKGKSNEVRLPAALTYLDESPVTQRRVKGDLLRLRSEFSIMLSDYGVTGPPGSDFIGLKVADTMQIKVSVFGTTDVPPGTIQADDRPAPTDGARPPPPKRPGQ
jgi:polyisoprenoid-binding protein YceI